MTKAEILKIYIGDLKKMAPKSPARDNRIHYLEEELKETIKKPIKKGCVHAYCFCDGSCDEIIGYE